MAVTWGDLRGRGEVPHAVMRVASDNGREVHIVEDDGDPRVKGGARHRGVESSWCSEGEDRANPDFAGRLTRGELSIDHMVVHQACYDAWVAAGRPNMKNGER